MSDFRLRVFSCVAKNLSFTKASQELFISQPAITKHIQELETMYQTRLFERMGNKISLTDAGRLLLELWGIERSGFFNGREKWAKGFENQRV